MDSVYRPVVGDLAVTAWGDWGIVEGVYYGGIGQEDFAEIRYTQSQTHSTGTIGRFKINQLLPVAASPKRKGKDNG